MPGEAERNALWRLHLPSSIPGTKEIDKNYLSKQYRLTGGQISIIVKNAAAEAAGRKEKSRKLTTSDLMKYCEIEAASMFGAGATRIGFEA